MSILDHLYSQSLPISRPLIIHNFLYNFTPPWCIYTYLYLSDSVLFPRASHMHVFRCSYILFSDPFLIVLSFTVKLIWYKNLVDSFLKLSVLCIFNIIQCSWVLITMAWSITSWIMFVRRIRFLLLLRNNANYQCQFICKLKMSAYTYKLTMTRWSYHKL